MGRQDAFVLDDKGRALLGKLRKGADASLSLPQLFKVLQFLGGWRIEDIVGLVPMHYEKDDPSTARGIKYSLWVEDEQKAREVYDVLQSLQVRSLPRSAKLGELFVIDLEPFRAFPQAYKKAWGTQYALWAAMPGYRITDPNGNSFELLPTRHDVSSGMSIRDREQDLPRIEPKSLLKRLGVGDIMGWLKKDTPYLDQINEVLGTEHHRPGAVRTRENTGTCGACFKNAKLEHARGAKLPVTVLHGYKRPGTGSIEGRCPGEHMPPYELSWEATELERRHLAAALTAQNSYIARLKSGQVTEFSPYFGAPIVRKSELTPALWEMEIRNQVKREERERDDLEFRTNVYDWLVKNWQQRDLPVEGKIEVDYYGLAARKVHASELAARRR